MKIKNTGMKYINKMVVLFLMLTASFYRLTAQSTQLTVVSPDKQIVLSLSVDQAKLHYRVSYKGRMVIEPSLMGLTINHKALPEATAFGVVSESSVNKTYISRGVHSNAVNSYTQAVIPVKSNNTPAFIIESRVFNNGIAFRYMVNNKGVSVVYDEETGFVIPAGSLIWSQKDIVAYEGRYQRQPIEEVSVGQLAGPPLTVRLPGKIGYMAITEGGLTDFAGMSLKADGNRGFKANLTGTVKKEGKVITPWRIAEIGTDLNTLVNCDIIGDVSAEPDKNLFPQGEATAWIHPGKSVWSWLATKHDVTLENMKHFSRLAGQLGFAYNLVDEGWSRWKEEDKDQWALMKELVDYSDSLGVKIWVWKAYPDRAGVPGLKDPVQRRIFFQKCQSLGIVGLKIDFFDAESQEVIDFYQAALKDAAELHLMLDFHGANKPTGESRTWPNEVSREAIRGLENTTDWPVHNTTLPFTRYLAGHGDYTPLSFRNQIIKGTTFAHQIATMGVFTSPFMCLAADPEEILKSPAKDMIIHMPTVWDETIVLPQSEIGSLALFARRSGHTWYLSALNGDTERQEMINLSFLGQGTYRSSLVEDDLSLPEKVQVSEKEFTGKSVITIHLMPGGGFVGKFLPAK
jgi:alpha-glucosidase